MLFRSPLSASSVRSRVISKLSAQASKDSKERTKGKLSVSSIWVNSSDEEASDEEEVANLCLVAREDGTEETLSDFESVHGDEVSITDLQEAYNHIHREFYRMTKAFKALKRKNQSL